jgi:hypothetical protein
MRICPALLLAALIVSTPLCGSAQIAGGQGELPGGPWTPPSARPASSLACQELWALRDETQKHGTAIRKANERRATVQEACKLFKNFLGAEDKFIKSLEENNRTCGVASDAIKQAKEGHAKAEQVGKQVCEAAAARSPRPTRMDPWDTLREGSPKQSEDENCKLCGRSGDFWWLDDRNRRPR